MNDKEWAEFHAWKQSRGRRLPLPGEEGVEPRSAEARAEATAGRDEREPRRDGTTMLDSSRLSAPWEPRSQGERAVVPPPPEPGPPVARLERQRLALEGGEL